MLLWKIERKVNGRITLEDARRDKSLRQEYLNQIIGTNSIPYCDGVVYDDDGRKLKFDVLEIAR